MKPDPQNLLQKTRLTIPLIGIYDAPDPAAFAPFAPLMRGRHMCLFSFYKDWLKGKTVHMTKDYYGCGGCGHWYFNVTDRTREEYIRFLVDDEGLKASHELMGRWMDHQKPYPQKHPNIMVGPLKDSQYEYLKTVTFFVTPDQMGVLVLGAQYYSAPEDPPPVIARFGAGCMEMLTLFDDFSIPQAMIGTLDIAMRQFLPPDVMGFTVTKPMYERLCSLDEKSFLYKPFLKNLYKSRGLTG